jgi:hypothetical protein
MKLSKVCRSKWKLPTHVRRQSQAKGELVHGAKTALRDIERQIGHKLEVVKTRHTPTQWRFYLAPTKRK